MAYLMSSAQRMVAEEVRAQQLLTGTARIRGRARHTLPRWVRPIGSTPVELGTAFRHERAGEVRERQVIPQVGSPAEVPLTELLSVPATAAPGWQDPWLTAFVDLLVEHGADPAVTNAALDRLADLLLVSSPCSWQWAARRGPGLAQIGLSPDQCGALVALVAGVKATPAQRHDRQPPARRPHSRSSPSTRSAVRRATAAASHLRRHGPWPASGCRMLLMHAA